jgi:hypothetical protein
VNQRDHGLDAARAYAMLLVVAVHASMSFMATPIGWVIQDRSYLEAVDLVVWVSHAFLMPVFFWLAGYFAREAVARNGIAGFARARVIRVLVPFALALVPTSLALDALWDSVLHRRATMAVPVLRGAEGLPLHLGHLWYRTTFCSSRPSPPVRPPRAPVARTARRRDRRGDRDADRGDPRDRPAPDRHADRFAIHPIVLVFHGAFFAWAGRRSTSRVRPPHVVSPSPRPR